MIMQLHGFADASETGYGAVVYARILHQDATITVTLVAAKARVAPKKSVTMPRLELLGSLLLSKLLPKIASILQVEEANTYYWIDSQIVLAWIQKDPQQLKTFVQNRVSAIQSATHKSRWNYVRTHQNPADHASRGLSPRQTVQNNLWWKGPPWLMSPPHLWPSSLEQNRIDYTGVDFAGPFDVKRSHTRKPVLVKAYACLFVCMSTKAVHIDCTEDLSTASFMLCFERFINRRGLPQHVYSDNAARTLGTPTQLPYDLQDFTAKTADLQAHGVFWHFIPARSPHCGGIWESGIRRMKEELRKTLHHFTPTAAEFHHLLITAEAVMNSRPLLPISLEEADSAQVITPGHFLIGRPIRAHPQDIPPPKDGLRKVRWSLLRAETEQLWKRWHTAYVQSLQSRQKWTRPQPNISVGDIVLLKDDSLKFHSWPLAKVTDVSPGPDRCCKSGHSHSPWRSHLYQACSTPHPSDESLRLLIVSRGGENVQDPRDGFGDYHSSSPERSQQRSQQP